MNFIKKVVPAIVAVGIVVTVGGIAGKNMIEKKELQDFREAYAGKPVGMTVTAHTGCMGTADNSIESIKMGMENADIVEFDVRFNEEKVPVLSHDSIDGDTVSFDDALKVVAESETTRVNIDLKEHNEGLSNLEKIVKKHKLTNRVFFTGVREENVSAVKLYCPDIKYYLNMDIDKKKIQNKLYQEEVINKLKENGAVGLNFHFGGASDIFVKAIKDAGFEVSIWTVDKEVDMYKVIAMKPDNITTKNPDLLNGLWEIAHGK